MSARWAWLLGALALCCRPEPVCPGAPVAVSSGAPPLDELIAARRTRRDFAPRPIERAKLARLAWAAQGVTDVDAGLRAVPSAGALYPLELYFVTAAGVLHYRPASNDFEPRGDRDLRAALSEAALGQGSVRRAPCVVVITSVTERTRAKYGARAERYVAMEAGHAGQNLLLEAVALGLAGGPVGAFDDARVSGVLGLPPGEDPLYLLNLGYPP